MAGKKPAHLRLVEDSTVSIEALFREYYAGLCDFVLTYVESPETARDLVQDLFLDLWARHEDGRLPPVSSGYLYTAARNRALKHLRHQGIVRRWREWVASEPAKHAPAADEEILADSLAEAIEKAVAQLPEKRRQIFLLSREEELSYSAIAEVLGISVKTVENQMARALKTLREQLLPYLVLAAGTLAGWVRDMMGG